MRKDYIDLMDRVVGAYTKEHIEQYAKNVSSEGISEHGFPRLTANIGILLAHGKKQELKDEFLKMMDLCCLQMPNRKINPKNSKFSVGNDFSVKEIVFCILEIEKSGIFPKELTDGWRAQLSLIDPYKTYNVIAKNPPEPINNWAAFGAASEQIRKYAGIGDEDDFIENQIASQLFSFDENGMYRDPNEPIVYDMVTRLQLVLAMRFGFDGKSRDALEKNIIKSANPTLYMQSVTGEIPFGGRSNRFYHNEAFFAALSEFYASEFKKRGNTDRAMQHKRSARLAVEYLKRSLSTEKLYHIKNCFDNDSMYGCENYAYFDKYMITAASWLYLAYVFADDTIKEGNCPAEKGGYFWESSKYFHKVIANCGGYFVELDTKADSHYDASGIGNISRAGIPAEVCIAVPFAQNPNYSIDINNPSPMSVCGALRESGEWILGCDTEALYNVIEKNARCDFVNIKLECRLKNEKTLYESISVSSDGVKIEVSGEGEIGIMLPAFDFDGKEKTKIEAEKNILSVSYKKHKCLYETDGIIEDTKKIYANRSGHYKCFYAVGKDKICVHIIIQ